MKRSTGPVAMQPTLSLSPSSGPSQTVQVPRWGVSSRQSSENTAQIGICLNTCRKARNGVCDDGRVNITFPKGTTRFGGGSGSVTCDLGTDCQDCGPWSPPVKPNWLKGKGPIATLLEGKVEVRVKPTTPSMDVKFNFAYTDPTKDVDVSEGMEFNQAVELHITQVFYQIFKDRCIYPDGSRSLFVDVGANFGWFSILAASMGCRVLAFEPVPHFRAFFEYNVHLNGLEKLIEIRSNIVSNVSGLDLTMVVPSNGIWGTAGIDGLNIDKNIPGSYKTITTKSVTVSELVKVDVLLKKIDVEGWEFSVMKGAAGLLSKFNVENIIMEYSPGVFERHFKFDELINSVLMLQNLLESGMRMAHLGFKWEHETTSSPFPHFDEITLENLKYDMDIALLYKANKIGCPLPKELEPFWHHCGAVPEHISPRSLRSDLAHNTNIWASKNTTLIKLGEPVGVLLPSDPEQKYYTTRNRTIDKELYGMGARRCRDMDPQWQVRHRCPCTNASVCGREEELLKKIGPMLVQSKKISTR